MFRNLNNSPFVLGEPIWQRETMAKVKAEFAEQANEINRDFHARAVAALATAAPESAGEAIRSLMAETPRFAFIKAVPDDDGKLYDVRVDLLLRHVTFDEIEKED